MLPQVDLEAQYMKHKVQEGRIVVHNTPCTNLRACGDVAPGMDAEHPDCRLLPDGTLQCPLKPRQKSMVGLSVLSEKGRRQQKVTARHM